jgi:hypothetical protein
MKKMGYHKRKIKKGIIGEVSKIREELEELEDSLEQDCKIMAAVELSDLYGAMEEYAKKHLNISMDDVRIMSTITKSAFQDGSRK